MAQENARYTRFREQHILDPEAERDSANWTGVEWSAWMRGRIGPGKPVNSVVITNPEVILDDFRDLNHDNNNNGAADRRYNAGRNLYWSNNRYHTMYMTWNNQRNRYAVRDLGQMHILAGIEQDVNGRNVPVHFHRQAPVIQNRGNVNINLGQFNEIP